MNNKMKSWAFRRPGAMCAVAAGVIQAKSGPEAIKLLHAAYGYCYKTLVFCAETDEGWSDEGKMQGPKKVQVDGGF